MNVKLLDLQAQYLPLRTEIRRAIDEVCDAQALILGPHVERFEKSLAAYCGTKHAIGVSSGTDALLCSLMALGIKPGVLITVLDRQPFDDLVTIEVGGQRHVIGRELSHVLQCAGTGGA